MFKKEKTTPVFEKVPLANKASFLFKGESFRSFNIPWHYHPEYEIALIKKGNGEIIVGNNVHFFKSGDLLFLGANLPHLWKSKDINPKKTKTVEQLIIQFPYDFLGRELFDKYEFQSIRNILQKSTLGLVFTGKTRETIAKKINAMKKAGDFKRLMSLLSILETMAAATEYNTISSLGFNNTFVRFDEERMNKLYHYILLNFQKEISTIDMASLFNMEESSFCRYFKRRTKKTFIQFLNEVRLGFACKLLLENVHSINQICIKCGFRNISNFNRQFRAFIGKTPGEYRNKLRNKV
jgi:AraC-like DNA-binding protein